MTYLSENWQGVTLHSNTVHDFFTYIKKAVAMMKDSYLYGITNDSLSKIAHTNLLIVSNYWVSCPQNHYVNAKVQNII